MNHFPSFPVKQATSIIVTAIKNFFCEDQDSSVTEVYLCDVKRNIVNDFTGALQKEFGEHSVTVHRSENAEVQKEFSKPQPALRSGNGNKIIILIIKTKYFGDVNYSSDNYVFLDIK